MNGRKGKLAAALAAIVLAIMVSAAAADARNAVVTVTNATNQKIFIAFGAVSEGGENDNDFSKGWWGIDPGKARAINIGSYSPVYSYFYYAQSADRKHFWAGSRNKQGSQAFWIHPKKAFNIHPDGKLAGGKRILFRPFNINVNGTARLKFTLR